VQISVYLPCQTDRTAARELAKEKGKRPEGKGHITDLVCTPCEIRIQFSSSSIVTGEPYSEENCPRLCQVKFAGP